MLTPKDARSITASAQAKRYASEKADLADPSWMDQFYNGIKKSAEEGKIEEDFTFGQSVMHRKEQTSQTLKKAGYGVYSHYSWWATITVSWHLPWWRFGREYRD